MRIVMLTPMLPRPDAAAAGPIVMHAQWRALSARHTVTLVTFAGPSEDERAALDEFLADGADVRWIWRAAPQGAARWRRRGRLAGGWLRGDRPLRALEFADPRMQTLLDRTLAEGRFALAQVEDNAMGAYRLPPALPTVLTEHDVRDTSSGAGERPPRRLAVLLAEAERRRWRRYQCAVWRRFDRIQVFTPRDARHLAKVAPTIGDRVRVNPFGVALPPVADPRGEDADTLLFVGGFAHPPNIDAALWLGRQIVPRLRAIRPSARLLIVGAQPPQAVRALADPGRGIDVTGQVPSLAPYLARAAVVAAPLREGGGMRLKVLQALAAGKAVVATTLATEGLAGGAGDEPLPLLVADDADTFAVAVSRLLDDREARAGVGARARAFVAQHHTWSAYIDRLEAIYDELLAQPAGGR